MTQATPLWEEVPCLLCHQNEAAVLERFDLPEGSCALVRCRRCGLCYVNPRPVQESMGCFYPETYYSFQPPSPPPPEQGLHARIRRSILRHRLGYDPLPDDTEKGMAWGRFLPSSLVALPRHVPGGRVLDVGCGSGAKLFEFQALGWQAEGLELSSVAAEAARRAGLTVAEGGLEQPLPWPPESFDAVTFYHSLEHLPSPLLALERARWLLKPGGEVVVVVPNHASWERYLLGRRWSWTMIPQHLYHFTPATLKKMAQRAGLQDIHIGFSAAGASLPTWGGEAGSRVMRLVDLLAVVCRVGKAILLTARKAG